MAEIIGSVSKNSSYYKYYLDVVEGDYDVATNSSPVTATLKIYTNYSGTLAIRYASATHTITIDGTDYTITTGEYTLGKNNTVVLGSATKVVKHDDDGSKKIIVSANSPDLAQGNGWGPYSGSASGEVTLITIPRASSVTCADGNIGSSTTINIVRAIDRFTHTLKYTFGSLSGTIVTKTNSTSYGWTIPTTFYEQIPNAPSGKGIITCETYDGNTLIGESECSFNAIVLQNEDNLPTITATIVDTNAKTIALTGDNNKLIKYFSNAKVTITATAKNSATIKSQKVTCRDGKSSDKTTYTFEGVESGIFDLVCMDSRNFPGTNTVTKEMIDYIKLAITELTLERENSTSNNIIISLRGNYFNKSFSASTSNTLELKWRSRIKGGEWQENYTVITPTINENTFSYYGSLGDTFDFNNAYEFEIVAIDKLITDIKSREVTRGIPLIDIWDENVNINGNVLENNKQLAKQEDFENTIQELIKRIEKLEGGNNE